MALIVLVGHYYGGDALTWAHANVGWMIFLGWVGLFWWVLFRYLVEPQPATSGKPEMESEIVPESSMVPEPEVAARDNDEGEPTMSLTDRTDGEVGINVKEAKGKKKKNPKNEANEAFTDNDDAGTDDNDPEAGSPHSIPEGSVEDPQHSG